MTIPILIPQEVKTQIEQLRYPDDADRLGLNKTAEGLYEVLFTDDGQVFVKLNTLKESHATNSETRKSSG